MQRAIRWLHSCVFYLGKSWCLHDRGAGAPLHSFLVLRPTTLVDRGLARLLSCEMWMDHSTIRNSYTVRSDAIVHLGPRMSSIAPLYEGGVYGIGHGRGGFEYNIESNRVERRRSSNSQSERRRRPRAQRTCHRLPSSSTSYFETYRYPTNPWARG